jgi:benzoylformate decarboxylase
MTVTVRDAIFDLMRRFGMTRVFGNPGSTELPMFHGFPGDERRAGARVAIDCAVSFGN